MYNTVSLLQPQYLLHSQCLTTVVSSKTAIYLLLVGDYDDYDYGDYDYNYGDYDYSIMIMIIGIILILSQV